MSDNQNHDQLEHQQLGFSTLGSLLRFLSPYKREIAVFLVALLLTAGITLSIGQGLRLLIDGGFAEQSKDNLNTGVLFIIGMAILMATGTYVRFYLISWLGERVSADIRTAVFNHVISLHPAFFETNRSGDIMSRLTSDTTLLQSIIGSSMSIALRSGISSLGALIMLLATNFKLSLIVLAAVPAILVPILYFGRRVRNLSRQSQDSIASVGSYAGEVIQQIKIVQSFTQESFEKAAFGVEVEGAFRVAKKRIGQRAILTALVILAIFVALSAMLWFGGRDVMAGTMTGGDLGAFLFYAMLMAVGIASLSEVYGELQRAAGATERLMELLHAPNEIKLAELVKVNVSNLPATLAFDAVTFCYPSRPHQPALNQFSINIPDGKIVALVGPSGAGKTTLVDLILGFLKPSKGILKFNADDAHKDISGWLSHCAYLPQDIFLINGTLKENITLSKDKIKDGELEEALKLSRLTPILKDLNNGLNTDIGDKGVQLSGGQKQRVSIARAIFNKRDVLLLDESISALDSETEAAVIKELMTLRNQKTIISIAHRISTLKECNKIFRVNNGRVDGPFSYEDIIKDSA